MRGIQAHIQERKAEAQTLLDLIDEVIARPNSVVKAAVLKSSHVLVLYNAIEATATEILERVHEIISQESYSDLNPELRRLWTEFFFCKQAEKKRFDSLEATVRGEARFPQLKDFLDQINLYSGNLDARAINAVLKRYGLGVITTPNQHKLLEIKNKRNRIAHGEEMFKEACRHLTVTELKSFQDACFDVIDSFLDQASEYLSTRKYAATVCGGAPQPGGQPDAAP